MASTTFESGAYAILNEKTQKFAGVENDVLKIFSDQPPYQIKNRWAVNIVPQSSGLVVTIRFIIGGAACTKIEQKGSVSGAVGCKLGGESFTWNLTPTGPPNRYKISATQSPSTLTWFPDSFKTDDGTTITLWGDPATNNNVGVDFAVWRFVRIRDCTMSYSVRQPTSISPLPPNVLRNVVTGSSSPDNKFQPGLYTLMEMYTSKVLDLDGGKSDDDTRLHFVNSQGSAPNQNGLYNYNRQFIIMPDPMRADGSWNIINVFSQTFLTMGDDGDYWRQTYGARRSLGDRATGWQIEVAEYLGSIAARFYMQVDNKKYYLRIRDAGSDSTQLIAQTRETGDDMKTLMAVDRVPVMNPDLAQWMWTVKDDMSFNNLAIPATHQSQAMFPATITDNPNCQVRAPYTQLQDGIRILDLRLNTFNDVVVNAHGKSIQGCCYGALLQCVRLFLSENPSETVIMRNSYEDSRGGPGIGNNRDFLLQRMAIELSPFKTRNMFKTATTLSKIQDSDSLRGYAVFATDQDLFKSAEGGRVALVPTQGPFIVSQVGGSYKNTELYDTCKKDTDFPNQPPLVKSHIEAAVKDSAWNSVYRLALNASQADPNIFGDGVPVWNFFNPITFNNYIQPKFLDLLKDFDKNPSTSPNLRRLGIVDLDFYDRETVAKVLSYNSNGPGGTWQRFPEAPRWTNTWPMVLDDL